jgi:hypothetical protein
MKDSITLPVLRVFPLGSIFSTWGQSIPLLNSGIELDVLGLIDGGYFLKAEDLSDKSIISIHKILKQ